MTPEEMRRARRDTALLTDAQLTQLHERGPDQWPPEAWEILKEELARRRSARGTGSDESPPLKGELRDYDRAFASFLYSGLAMFGMGLVALLPMEEGTRQTLGFLAFLPLVVIWFGVTGRGLFLAFRLWQHWPLRILALNTLLCVLAGVALQSASSFVQSLVAIPYVAGTFGLPAWWFRYARKRYDERQGGTSPSTA